MEVDLSGSWKLATPSLEGFACSANVEFLTDTEELIAVASAVKEEVVEEAAVEGLEGVGIAEPEVIENCKAEDE